MSGAPLEDPAYKPKHPPVNGEIPEVVAKWGAASQLRWFQRFGGQLGKRRDWDRYYVHSVGHRGPCCTSCEEDGLFPDRCCCKAPCPA